MELHEIYEIICGDSPTLPSYICLSRNAVLQTSVLEFTESSLGVFSLHAYGACKNSYRFLYTTKHFTSLAHGFAPQIRLKRGKVTYLVTPPRQEVMDASKGSDWTKFIAQILNSCTILLPK